jgi:hypothetical protein
VLAIIVTVDSNTITPTPCQRKIISCCAASWLTENP